MVNTDPGRKCLVCLCRKLFQLEKEYGYKASKDEAPVCGLERLKGMNE